MNETSPRTRVEPCICATASSRWITRVLFRSSTCLFPRKHQHETFSLRADRKLENRSCANALEPDAFNAHGTRRYHRHHRCHINGNCRERHLYRLREKHATAG